MPERTIREKKRENLRDTTSPALALREVPCHLCSAVYRGCHGRGTPVESGWIAEIAVNRASELEQLLRSEADIERLVRLAKVKLMTYVTRTGV